VLKVLKAFTPNTEEGDKNENLIERELKMMTKVGGWNVEFKDGLLSVTNEKGTDWMVKFLFVSAATEKEIKKNKQYKIKNLAIVGREQLISLGSVGVLMFWVMRWVRRLLRREGRKSRTNLV
jgi:hypothetical protein